MCSRIIRTCCFVIAALLTYVVTLAAPTYADSLQDITGSLTSAGDTAAWGDYDNDGLQDLAMSSPSSTKIYRAGGTSFTDIGITLPSARFIIWGDIDNDSDLDLFIIGSNMYPDTDFFRNDGGGVFTRLNVVKGQYMVSFAQFADYDNDGDLDLMTVESSYGSDQQMSAGVYVNDGKGVFRHGSPFLTAPRIDGVSWADYDGDGDWDFLALSGPSQWYMSARIYKNDGNGAFSAVDTSLTKPYYPAFAWGDYDGDGDQDLLWSAQAPGEGLAGSTATKAVT